MAITVEGLLTSTTGCKPTAGRAPQMGIRKLRRVRESGVRLIHAIHIGTPLQSSSGNHGFTEHERPVHEQGARPPDRPVGRGDARQPAGGDQKRVVADAEPARGSRSMVGKRRTPESGGIAETRNLLVIDRAWLQGRAFLLPRMSYERVSNK